MCVRLIECTYQQNPFDTRPHPLLHIAETNNHNQDSHKNTTSIIIKIQIRNLHTSFSSKTKKSKTHFCFFVSNCSQLQSKFFTNTTKILKLYKENSGNKYELGFQFLNSKSELKK